MGTNSVLIVSNLPFRNDTNLGKTLCTLFSGYKPTSLSQLFFHPQTPNVPSCRSYFQICEYQLLKSVGGIFDNNYGKIISSSEIDTTVYQPMENNPSIFVKIKDNSIVVLLRELIWRISLNNLKKMWDWCVAQAPGVIFCVMSDSIKHYKITRKIALTCNAPVVLFITDDYYYDYKKHPSLLRKFRFYKLHKAIDDLQPYLLGVVGCSELAAEDFGRKFNVRYKSIFTPAGLDFLKMKPNVQDNNNLVIFRYFGNLGLERWKSLVRLGNAIAKNNKKGGRQAILQIYSNLQDTSIIEQLDIPNGSQFCGWVYGLEYMELLQSCHVAVHVESFSEEMCRRTRLSISTKIADYLGASKCIIAIGRNDLASINHIKNVAYTVHDMDYLEQSVWSLTNDDVLRKELQEKAHQLAISQHNMHKISLEMRNFLDSGSYNKSVK